MVCQTIPSIVDASLDAAFVLDGKTGGMIHINPAGQRLFDCPANPGKGSDDMRTNYSSFFIFADRELSEFDSGSTWSQIVGPLVDAKTERHDVTAYLRDGSEFDASVSLTHLAGCTCCSGGEAGSSIICAYLRETSTSQQRYVTSLEREIRRLQSSECALDASFDAFFGISTAGTILTVNKAAVQVFGWSRDEMVGRNIKMIVGGKHHERHDQYIKRYLKTGEKRVMGMRRELPARRKDGTEFTIELGLIEVKSAFRNESTFCGFIKDLSKQKHQEEQTSLKEKLMSGMIEASPDPMLMIDQTGIIKMVNSAASDIFGWTRAELMEQNVSVLAGGEHARNHDKYLAAYLKTGEKKAMGKKRELKARKKSGEQFVIELGLSEVELANGERMFCGFIRDLSKQKLAEQKQRAMIESSPEAMFEIDEKGKIIMVNKAASKIFGWTREEFLKSNISIIVGGGHAKSHDKYLARYLATGEKRVMGMKRELPARRKDGTEFIIELGLTEVVVGDGHHVFCGFVKDLTEQKANEDRIKRKEQLTMGMINSSFDAMFQINERGIIQMVNQAAVDHFGWTKEEFLGNNISMIAGGEHGKKHNQYLERYLRTGEKKAMGKRRQVNAVRRDGTEFPIELGLTEVETIWGERFFCGFVRDVRRERYDAQELLEQATLTKAILEQSGQFLLTCDEYGLIHSINASLLKLLGLKKEDTIGKDLKLILGTEYAKKRVGDDLHKFIRNSSGREVDIEALKACGTIIPMKMRLKEVEGTFNIMLGMNTKTEGPKGTRLFAAFFREKEERVTPNQALFGLLGALQKEENAQ